MIQCKICGYKMPQNMATPLKCACGEPLGTGMFVMVDAKEFEEIQAVLTAVDALVLAEGKKPTMDEIFVRVQGIKDAYKRMKN